MVIAGTIIISVSIWGQYRLAAQIMNHDLEGIEQNIVPIVSYLVWVLNEEQTSQAAQSLLNRAGITAVRIETFDQQVMLNLTLSDAPPGETLPRSIARWPLVYRRGTEEMHLGYLHVEFLHPWRYAFDSNLFLAELLIDVFVILVIIALAIVAVRFYISGPVRRLVKDIRRVDFARPLPEWWASVERTDPNGETGMIRRVMAEASLRIQNEIRERLHTEAELASSLEQKSVLLQEVHHRVKNNLQVITSLISLQRQSITSDAARAALQDSENRIMSMALVHELLYREQQYSRIDLRHYLQDLSQGVVYQGQVNGCTIRLQHELAEIDVPLDKAIPIGLILNELLTNAVKHAFTDRPEGLITVSTERTDDTIVLSISDDGRGIPPDKLDRRSGSLGLLIVETLCTQLEATLNHIPRDRGACFHVVVPL